MIKYVIVLGEKKISPLELMST